MSVRPLLEQKKSTYMMRGALSEDVTEEEILRNKTYLGMTFSLTPTSSATSAICDMAAE